MFLVPYAIGGGLGIFGVNRWMDHRHKAMLNIQNQNFSALQNEIARKIYNTYFSALDEFNDHKITQKEYGDQVFKFSRTYLVSNQGTIPR